MFKGSDGLTLDSDHLDISFRNRDAWPSHSPKGSLRGFTIELGDAVAGPTVLLGNIRMEEGENLDWRNDVDPVHYHGTDQFRTLAGGDWVVAGRPLPTGGYCFQEAGWTYQEHPLAGAAWMIMVMGDRRGMAATIKRKNDDESGEIYGQPVYIGGEYPHPAGPKGLAAINTTLGPCDRGYLMGKIAEFTPADGVAVVSGVLGDEKAGPLVHVIKAQPGKATLPACAYDTETLFVVVGGSCTIGGAEYQQGDLRIQRPGEPMPEVVGGPKGVEAVLVIADRRARATPGENAAALPEWVSSWDRLRADLAPTPGGPPSARADA